MQAWLKQLDLKASDFLIALPVIHLVLTISYIFSYGVVFGGGVRSILSVSDVVNTAIRQMPIIYVVCIISPVLSFVTSSSKETVAPDRKGRITTILVILVVILAGVALLSYGIMESRRVQEALLIPRSRFH
jgi:uncharacterized membrane protein